MKITVAEARERLANIGIELGGRCQTDRRRGTVSYEVTTPVGTKTRMRSPEIAGLLRDLERYGRRV